VLRRATRGGSGAGVNAGIVYAEFFGVPGATPSECIADEECARAAGAEEARRALNLHCNAERLVPIGVARRKAAICKRASGSGGEYGLCRSEGGVTFGFAVEGEGGREGAYFAMPCGFSCARKVAKAAVRGANRYYVAVGADFVEYDFGRLKAYAYWYAPQSLIVQWRYRGNPLYVGLLDACRQWTSRAREEVAERALQMYQGLLGFAEPAYAENALYAVLKHVYGYNAFEALQDAKRMFKFRAGYA